MVSMVFRPADPAKSLSATETGSRTSLVNAALVAFGTLGSRVLGLIRDAYVARYFGPEIRDAFVIAFRLPNLIRRTIAEGSISSIWVPAIAEMRARGDAEGARRLASGVFAAFLAVAAFASVLGVVLMEPALNLLLSGESFRAVPGKFELTVRLAKITFGFLFFASSFASFAALLHAVGRFAWASFAPILFNATVLAVAFAQPRELRSTEANAVALAWAVLAGGALQAAILIPAVRRTGLWPRARRANWSPAVARVLGAAAPTAFSLSLLQATAFANLWFASRLPQGSHSYLYLADRILELPLSLFASSVAAASLPTLAADWAAGRRAQVGHSVERALHLILFITAINAVGMIFLADPIVEALFVGKEFSLNEAAQTARALQVSALTLIAAAASRILAQAFFAARQATFPAIAALAGFICHLVLAGPLASAFGAAGLAGAAAASQAIFVTLLALGFRSRIARFDARAFARSVPRLAACVAAAAVAAQAAHSFFAARVSPAFPKIAALFSAMACAAAAFFAVAALLRAPEIAGAMRMISGKRE